MRNFLLQKIRNFDHCSFREVSDRVDTESYAGRVCHLGPCAPGLYRGAHMLYIRSCLETMYIILLRARPDLPRRRRLQREGSWAVGPGTGGGLSCWSSFQANV